MNSSNMVTKTCKIWNNMMQGKGDVWGEPPICGIFSYSLIDKDYWDRVNINHTIQISEKLSHKSMTICQLPNEIINDHLLLSYYASTVISVFAEERSRCVVTVCSDVHASLSIWRGLLQLNENLKCFYGAFLIQLSIISQKWDACRTPVMFSRTCKIFYIPPDLQNLRGDNETDLELKLKQQLSCM